MTLTTIILIILLGIILLLLEIFVIPGVGITAVIGIALLGIGIYFGYKINSNTGHLIFAGTFLVSVALFTLSLRAKTWDRVSLKSEIEGKVNLVDVEIKAGDKGKTVSRLAPMGKVIINGQFAEAASLGDYINENSEIEVIKVEGNKIFVKNI